MIHEVLVRADDTPRMSQFAYEQCRHIRMKRDGFRYTPGGIKQRWQCVLCSKVFIADAKRPDVEGIGRALLVPGATIWHVSRRFKSSIRTVRQIARVLEGHRPDCPCGKPASHGGRCAGSMVHSNA